MSTLCRAAQKWQKYGGAETSENPFFCQTHLSAFLKGERPPVQFRRSQSQSVAVIRSLKWRDHPPLQHLPGMKPLKGRVKEGRKISDYFFRERDRFIAPKHGGGGPGRCAGRLAPHFRAKAGQSQSKWIKPVPWVKLAAKSYANALS
jgi:hypothetical protein